MHGLWRILLFLVALALMGVPLYLAFRMGIISAVTWACNHDLLICGWLFMRAIPSVLGLGLLNLLRLAMRRNPAFFLNNKNNGPSRAEVLAVGICTLSWELYGLILICGTAVLVSMTMIGGSRAVICLLTLPCLVAALNGPLSFLCELGLMQRRPIEKPLHSFLTEVAREAQSLTEFVSMSNFPYITS